MKKLLKLAIAVCVLSSVFAFAFCADYEPYSKGFVKVFGTTIRGRPNWAKDSEVFIEGRTVTIPTLIVCDHEVTQAEFKSVMKTLPSGQAKTSGKAENNPVNMVTWYDAIEYCNALSRKEGLTLCYKISDDEIRCDFSANGYRLPTEAEWEYLERGKEGYEYSGSNNIDYVTWHLGNSEDRTHEVKTKKSNAFGLYDMSGNVTEWCWDAWDYTIDETTSFYGPSSGACRVFRGGCWSGIAYFASVSFRSFSFPNNRYYSVGFRVVRSAK